MVLSKINMFLLVFVFYFVLISTNAQRACPVGWILNNDYGVCYKPNIGDLAKNWYQARLACKTLNAELASNRDKGEKDILERSLRGNIEKYFWLGGYRRITDKAWVWSDSGNYIQENQISWSDGKPDQFSGDCVVIINGTSYSNDDCNVVRPYVCKRPMGLPTTCDIDNGWEEINGTCIKIFQQKESWTRSRSNCQNEGGDLVVVKSDQIQSYLKDWTLLYKKPFWIGLSDTTNNDGYLHWVDDHYAIFSNYWIQFPPNFVYSNSSSGNCTVINNGYWSLEDCSNDNFFGCQKDLGQCPDGWIAFKNKCYLINSPKQKHTSWFEASSICSNYGGNLLTISNVYEQLFVERELKDSFVAEDFWLGFSDLKPVTNEYTWVTQIKVKNYTNWLNGQPVSEPSRDNCGLIALTSGKWYVNSNCFQKLPYICEIEVNKPVSPNPSNFNTYGGNSNGRPCQFPFIYNNNSYYQCITQDRDSLWCSTTINYDLNKEWGYCPTVKDCDVNWSFNINSCYRSFVNLDGVTYAQANTFCSNEGGSLALVKTAKSQTFIDGLVSNSETAWIGLSGSQNSQWIWSDGTSLGNEFKNWRLNHPNSTSQGSCVAIDSSDAYLGEWMSLDCNSKLNQFICQKNPLNTIVTVTVPPTTTPSLKCGANWLERPLSDFCYHFSTNFETFKKANEACNAISGSLVAITSVDEQLFIQNTLQSGKSYWIGAYRESFRKGWSWYDKSYPFVYSNWAQMVITSPNEYCAVVSDQLDGRWKTVECDNANNNIRYNYICKKRATTDTQASTLSTAYPTQSGANYGCPKGWFYYKTNQCYKYYNQITDHKTFNDAKYACKANDNADLVEVFSEGENQFLVSLIQMDRKLNQRAYGCPSGWTLNDDQCYKTITTTTKDWNLAQKYCSTNFGADLFSVKSSNENTFITQFAQKKPLWIGLKKKSNTNVWEWADDTIASGKYSNWEVGNPLNINNMDRCGLMNGSSNFKWIDVECVSSQSSYEFICQKDATIQDKCTSYLSPTTNTGGICVHQDQCPSLYVSGLCDEINNPDLTCCLDTTRVRETVWIGMYNDLLGVNGQVLFKWNSGTQPAYTNWAPDEPNSISQCVSFHIKDSSDVPFDAGQWVATSCNYKNGYFCKKPVQIVPVTSAVQDQGCPLGFQRYETKCFKYVIDLYTWQEAENNCKALNASLVSIPDRFEQYWLIQQLQTSSSNSNGLKWIGLNDLQKPGTYEWSNKYPVTFTNWDRFKPDQSNGRCIAMDFNGFWSNYDCNLKYSSICMTENTLYTTPTTPTTPVPLKCPAGWTEAQNKCYKLFNPSADKRLNWFEAENYCKNLGGHLASYNSLSSINAVSTGQQIFFLPSDLSFWIGLNALANKGFEWIDGSAVNYENWDFGYPQKLNGVEECVEYRTSNRWRDTFCYVNKGWICSIEKGVDPNNATSQLLPVNKFNITECANNGKYNWTLYRDKCYYVSSGVNEEKASWYKARDFCRSIGGDLLSIHTRQELEYTATIAGKKLDKWWLGLNKISISSGFAWSDGSPLNFINWNKGEPNNGDGGENCVEMYGSNSYWNDAQCGIQQAFICEKANRSSIVPYPDAVLPLSFNNGNQDPCPSGYSTFGVTTQDNQGQASSCVFPFKYNQTIYYECITFERNNPWCATTFDYDTDKKWGYCAQIKCFRLVSDAKKFSEARTVCKKDDASLASVHNELEQAFLTALLRKKTSDHWLGLWAPGQIFYYEDNSILDYSSWGPGKPGNFLSNDKCVVMSSKKEKAGLWENVNCDQPYSFVCSKYANDVQYASGCEASFLGTLSENVTLTCSQNTSIFIIKGDFGRDSFSMSCDDKYHYGGDCTSRASTTEKLRQLCQGKQTCNVTASIDVFTDPCPFVIKQLRVWYQCVTTPIISTGGNSNKKPCVFPFKYNNIMHYQCSFEKHPFFNNKKWCCTNADCDVQFEWGECPETNNPLQATNNCPTKDYTSVDNGKNCYKTVNEKKKWLDAKKHCEENENAKLVTITDAFEQSYMRLLTYVTPLDDHWIGIIRNNSNQFYWSDDWPVEYTNWDENFDKQTCGYIESSNGKWKTADCDTQLPFICKVTKEVVPVVTPPPPGFCADNWKEFGSSCYNLESLRRSLPDAKYLCAQKSGFIVSIQSQEELAFVNSLTTGLFSSQIWIGLEKNPFSNTYFWHDGSPLSFEAFVSNFQGKYQCVYMSSGSWYDYDCLNVLPYVCERPRVVPTPTDITSTVTTTTTTTTTTTAEATTQSSSSSSSTQRTSSTSKFQPITTATTESSSSIPIVASSSKSSSSLSTKDLTTNRLKPQETQPNKPGTNGGAVFGIILAVVLTLALVCLIALIVLKRKGFISIRLPIIDSYFFRNSENLVKYSNNNQNASILSNFSNPNYS